MMLWEHSSEAIPGGSGAFLHEAIRLSSRLSRYTNQSWPVGRPFRCDCDIASGKLV